LSGSDNVVWTVKARTGGLFIAAAFLLVMLSFPTGASATRDRTGMAEHSRVEASLVPAALDASCPRGSKAAIIAGTFKCLRVGAACKARYQAAYRKYGFKCVSGRLRRLTAPPPAPPPGQPGHYKGTTSQNEKFEFDVTSNGRGVTNVVTGQINEGCNGGVTLSGFAGTWITDVLPIDASGGFASDAPYITTVSSSAATGRFTLTGHLNGAVGVGNFQKTTNFSANATAYTCGSGLQTWTVTRVS
jgi:hypothetical protein